MHACVMTRRTPGGHCWPAASGKLRPQRRDEIGCRMQVGCPAGPGDLAGHVVADDLRQLARDVKQFD